MKIPVFILSGVLGGVMLLEAWTLNALVELKTDVAAIKIQLMLETKQIAQN